MAEKKVSEMSIEELIHYREQLNQKLSEIEFYVKNAKRLEACTHSDNAEK